MTFPTRQRGYLLITVVFGLFLLATVAVVLSQGSASKTSAASSELEASRANYLTRAGMQHALWRAANNSCMGDVAIPSTALGNDNYSASISGASSGTAYTLQVDQDAWIRSDDVTANNGANSNLHIRYESGNIEHVLVRFDLSPLPANAQINSATAWFYITSTGPGGGSHPEGPITIHQVTSDWTESEATWENMNGNFGNSVLATIPAQSDKGIWVNINVTAQIQAWVNGDPNYGFLMASTAEGVHAKYIGQEGTANEQPYIEVVTGSGSASPVTAQATGTLAVGIARTLSDPVTTAYQPPVTHTIAPGAAESEDAEIWQQSPGNNYGNADETWVSSASSDTTRTLLRFDMAAIPAGTRILDATLSLYRQSGSGADQPISAHRMTRPWSEDSVTWNSRESGTNWTTPGGDFESTAVATTPVGPDNERYEWNITQLAQGWADGSYPNYGVALVAAVDGLAGERFYTSDQASFERRPLLSVTYACQCGTSCLAPQGSGNILMVIGNSPANPAAEDVSIRERLESWGYTVSYIQDDDSQGNFDAGMSTNDVVFVSETVNGNNIGSKLTNTSTGVITAERNIVDELGIATANSTPVTDTADIIDNSHFISAVFQTGTVPIKTHFTQLANVSGTVAPGAEVLANVGGSGGLVALDAGATTSGGGTAAGRRVLLPVGESTTGWRYLTNAGQLMAQRSIAWAMSTNVVSVGDLLLVVGNDGSLTTQEQAKKTLLESWGYTVNVIDEDDSQGQFDAATAVNDVVFVTEDVNAADVGTKLNSATIGVVTEEVNLSDELGFGGDLEWESGTSLVIDNNHHITSPLASGSVTLLTSSESLGTISASIAPDIAALGRYDGEIALAALDAGDALGSGGNAAGRRVLLPWGGNDMDVNHLNADGLTVFQRALEWGTGVGCGSTTPLLLVVGDSSNPSSDDIARRDLIASWCYTVTLIDASAEEKLIYNTATANDVIYISEEVDHTQLLLKVRNIPVGIVSEERYQYSHLGFASGMGSSVSMTTTELVDIGHPITAGLPLGDLVIVNSTQPLQNLQSTLSPDLKVLGTHPSSGNPSLAVLETGDAIWTGGTPVPAHRVFLPWGGDAFEFAALNTDGQTIMRQAIEWAAAGLSSEGSNDAEQLSSDGTMYVDSTDLELADNIAATGQPTDIVGIRFPDVSVAQGETVNSAYIQFQVDELDSGAASLTIEGEATDNALPFSAAPYNITERTRTVASVAWSPPVWTTVGARGPDQRTADLTPIVQEIVNRPGWVEGNAIVFIISGSGVRTAEAYEGDPAGAPTFHVTHGLGGGGGGSTSYVETNELWWPGSADVWETVDLSAYGVPANAVVEVALMNNDGGRENWIGARAAGSNLDRRFQLHEAEGGGNDVMVLHVQADANSRIETYADRTNSIAFTLLGYWTGAAYTELDDSFTAGGSNSWRTHGLASYGVPPNSVVDIAIANARTSSEYRAGARRIGSSYNRIVDIHEAESGGNDSFSLMAQTGSDLAASIEVLAESDGNITFNLVGYWTTPPGTYVEYGGGHISPTQTNTWHSPGLLPVGVPANAVAQFAISNENTGAERQIGIREMGSGLNRVIDLQEAESGGSDTATLHVTVNGSSQFQIYVESSTSNVYFYPLGWWVLN